MEKYTYKNVEQKQNKYTFEVKAEYALYEEFEAAAYKNASKNVKIPGFRPGKAPKDMIEKEIAAKVFNNAINAVLPSIAEDVLEKEKLNPIANLSYELKDFDKEHGLIFTFTFYAQPKINVDNLKKIKISEPKAEVTDAEVLEVIKNMIRNNVPEDKIKFKEEKEQKKEEGKEKKGESAEEQETKVKDFDVTDELVKELGYENESTVEGLKTKVKSTLEQLKKEQLEGDFINAIIDETLKVVDFDIPDEMVASESERLEEDFRGRLKQIKLNEENYLKTQGTSIEEMRKRWNKEAKDHLMTDLTLINLAVQEKTVPTEAEVDAEIEKIENPKVRAQYKVARNKDYLRTLMTREKGLKQLIEFVRKNNE